MRVTGPAPPIQAINLENDLGSYAARNWSLDNGHIPMRQLDPTSKP